MTHHRVLASRTFVRDFARWTEESPAGARAVHDLVRAIERDPFDGPGRPEPLARDLKGWWSRRIDRQHRLIYAVRDDEVFLIRCREHYVGIDPKLETRVRRWEARHEEKTRVRWAIAGRLRAERRRPPPGEVRIEEDERGFRIGWKRPHEQTRWTGRSPDLHGACVIVRYAGVRSREEVVQLEREFASRHEPTKGMTR